MEKWNDGGGRAFISEIDEAIDKAKKTFKDYRPLLNGDRWISDREAAEFLKVSRHTLFTYRQKGRRTRFFPWHTLPEHTSADVHPGWHCPYH